MRSKWIMKKIFCLSIIMLLSSALTGCNTSSKPVGTPPDSVNYVFDAQRIDGIAEFCQLSLSMLEDESTPAKELNARMSQVIDTLEFAIRYCQDFEFDMWMRGYARHITMPVVMDDRLNDALKRRIVSIPYEWTVSKTDSAAIAYATLFRNSREVFDRFTNVILLSDKGEKKCMFVVSNYSDTIIEDMTIGFFGETDSITTLHATDAEMIDYDDYGAGILRVIFPLGEIMPLLERSSTMEVSYNAKREQVLMKHLLFKEEIDFVKGVIGADKMK